MTYPRNDLILNQLYDAFVLLKKPNPLSTYENSQCDEQVDAFNALDWEEATYSDVIDGMEGMIICPPLTKAYLIPRLFKIVMLRRSGKTNGAVDNLSMQLESWPVEEAVEKLLGDGQKKAIIAAWSYLDCNLYYPSGSHVARELAKHWDIEG